MYFLLSLLSTLLSKIDKVYTEYYKILRSRYRCIRQNLIFSLSDSNLVLLKRIIINLLTGPSMFNISKNVVLVIYNMSLIKHEGYLNTLPNKTLLSKSVLTNVEEII